VQYLTWETDPAVLCTKDASITCIESKIRKLGFSASIVARIVSKDDSLAIFMFLSRTFKRCARSWIWFSDSSPEIIRTVLPCVAISFAICNVRVDLPMPGSPVKRVKLDVRKPPFRTLLSSSDDVFKRLFLFGVKLFISVTFAGFDLIWFGRLVCCSMICSSKEFHSWHCEHCPAQTGLS